MSKPNTQKVKASRGAPKKATAKELQSRIDKYELEDSKFDAKVLNNIDKLYNVIYDMALDEDASPTNRKSAATYLIEKVMKKYDKDEIAARESKAERGDYSPVEDGDTQDQVDNVVSLIDLTPFDDAAEG